MTEADKKILREMRETVTRLARKIDGARGGYILGNSPDHLTIGKRIPRPRRSVGDDGIKLLWVKITGNESGGGKYTGKSYTVGVTTDVPAAGNLAESELGTVAAAVDCRVLNFAEEGQTTHALTAGTPRADTWLCHWFYTNSDGIKVCAVNALDIELCSADAATDTEIESFAFYSR